MKSASLLSLITLSLWVTSACAATQTTQEVQPHPIIVDGESYSLLENVTLIRDPNWQRVPSNLHKLVDAQKQLTQAATQNSQEDHVLARFGNMLLVPSKATATSQSTQSSTENKKNRSPLFIRHNNSGKISMVNGEIFATLKNPEQAQRIADDYGITLSFILKKRQRAIFQSKPIPSLFETFDAMQKDPRLKTVTVRLIDNLAVPH